MGFSERLVHCLVLVVLLAPHRLHFASSSSGAAEEEKKLYIVYLGERQHEDADAVTASHHSMLASILGSEEEARESIVYSYKHGFSGFSAMLTESHVRKIAALPAVLSVRRNKMHRMHRTRSWDFLGLDFKQPNGLLAKANYGDGIIIGVIDSGIWPESPSFAGDGYGPPPPKWKGICQTGDSFGAHHCNGKIIGARWYANDVDKSLLVGEFLSARDVYGHGTHTASIAAGNVVHNISFHGLAQGVTRGGAPRARLAIYKACWASTISCSHAAIMKAIDDAIHDRVDILSLSLGSVDEVSGSLHAVANGISVVYAAGNYGPVAQTVENSSPWLLTVAATTVDRSFPTVITLGDNQQFVGQSLFTATKEADQFHRLYILKNTMCDPAYLNNTKLEIKGKVIFCFTPDNILSPPDFSTIALVVAQKGGKGFISATYNTDLLNSWNQLSTIIPIIAVDFEIAYKIYKYSSTTHKPRVKISITQTTIGTAVPAPKVAAFSSRGPSPLYPAVLKPDIAAPGATILAAAPQTYLFKKIMGVSYRFSSGTSMSCPHVSGVVAMLKSLHPDWSPAALKSALMTTASVTDNNGLPILANGRQVKIADPFDYGAGFVNPSNADDPGLIYDINPSDYLRFFDYSGGLGENNNCTAATSLTNLNLPSIVIPNLKTTTTILRTVTNVGQPDAMYKVFYQSPVGVEMYVEPPMLVFNKNKMTQTFKVEFKATQKVQGDYTFGNLVWHDGGNHWVRIPIVVRIIIEELYSNIS